MRRLKLIACPRWSAVQRIVALAFILLFLIPNSKIPELAPECLCPRTIADQRLKHADKITREAQASAVTGRTLMLRALSEIARNTQTDSRLLSNRFETFDASKARISSSATIWAAPGLEHTAKLAHFFFPA
jgi:hypothetical protein